MPEPLHISRWNVRFHPVPGSTSLESAISSLGGYCDDLATHIEVIAGLVSELTDIAHLHTKALGKIADKIVPRTGDLPLPSGTVQFPDTTNDNSHAGV